ncbi:MAG: hypothetical protein QOG04_92 [Actinomycetota bacterium]|jgi:hypothetical protein|nr:hypothetical protein [Actinomycetota bacterium]
MIPRSWRAFVLLVCGSLLMFVIGAPITAQAAGETFSVTNAEALEGNPAVFTVSISPAANHDVPFTWVTLDDSASSPADYVGGSGAGVILAGQRSATVSIPTVFDNENDPDEVFGLNVTSSEFGMRQGAGTIKDLFIGTNPTSTPTPTPTPTPTQSSPAPSPSPTILPSPTPTVVDDDDDGNHDGNSNTGKSNTGGSNKPPKPQPPKPPKEKSNKPKDSKPKGK